MATNELLPFANGENANILPTNQWQALTDILENGFQSGIARSEQINRVLAQGAIASYVLGQLIVDELNQDATLDPATLYANLVNALQENAKDACLPLRGGTMTGTINFKSVGGINSYDDSKHTGVHFFSEQGGTLHLRSASSHNIPKTFSLVADGQNWKGVLDGNENDLLWNNHSVVTIKSLGDGTGTQNFIEFGNRFKLLWGNIPGASRKSTVTFVSPFNFAPAITATINFGSTTSPNYYNESIFIDNVTTTSFEIVVKNDANYPSTLPMSFIAIGY